MDWSRAKTVLILAFFTLNAVLGYQIWIEAKSRMKLDTDWILLSEETKQIMRKKNIEVIAKIPSETPKMSKIQFKIKSGFERKNRVVLKKPIDSKLMFSPSELAFELQEEIPDIRDYEFDPVSSTGGVFVLHNLYQKRPMFEVRLEFYYSNQKINSYSKSEIEAFQSSGENEQEVLSATKALGNLIENYLPADSIVKELKLGFHGRIYNSNFQVSFPAWRVILENGSIYYIHAISGEVDQPEVN